MKVDEIRGEDNAASNDLFSSAENLQNANDVEFDNNDGNKPIMMSNMKVISGSNLYAWYFFSFRSFDMFHFLFQNN